MLNAGRATDIPHKRPERSAHDVVVERVNMGVVSE